jgi:hypothetical protein
MLSMPADVNRLIAVMLGVLQMDLDTCIKEYLAMAPKIFPVEGIFSGSKLGKFLKIAKGEQRFDPTAFEKIIKKLIAEQLKTRSSDGENTPLRFEASKNQPCKVYVRHPVFHIQLLIKWE